MGRETAVYSTLETHTRSTKHKQNVSNSGKGLLDEQERKTNTFTSMGSDGTVQRFPTASRMYDQHVESISSTKLKHGEFLSKKQRERRGRGESSTRAIKDVGSDDEVTRESHTKKSVLAAEKELTELVEAFRHECGKDVQVFREAFVEAFAVAKRESRGDLYVVEFFQTFLGRLGQQAASEQAAILLKEVFERSVPGGNNVNEYLFLANLSPYFAVSSFEMERCAELLRAKLQNLVEMDGSVCTTFERFADKKLNVIKKKNFLKLVHQILRKSDDKLAHLNFNEIENGLFRYIDRHGFGYVDQDRFKLFLDRTYKLPAVFEHAHGLSLSAMNSDPLVVTNVIALRHEPTMIEKMELAEEGFERALGADFGVWVQRKRAGDFSSEDQFRRAMVTDIMCYWGESTKDDERRLILQGFVLQEPRKGKNLRNKSKGKAYYPRVWVRRNKEDDPVFNVFMASMKIEKGNVLFPIPPCQTFRSHLHIESNQKMDLPGVLFLRKLRYGSPSDLEQEFENLESAYEKNKARWVKKQREVKNEQHLAKIQTELVEQMIKAFHRHMTSKDCLKPSPLLSDIDIALEQADERHVGWISVSKALKFFKTIGTELEDEKCLQRFIRKRLMVRSSERVLVRSLMDLFPFNPAKAQMLIIEMCMENRGQVDQVIMDLANTRHTCTEIEFESLANHLSKHTHAEYRPWETKCLMHLFPGPSNEKLDLQTFMRVLDNVSKTLKEVEPTKLEASVFAGGDLDELFMKAFANDTNDQEEAFRKFFSRTGKTTSISMARFKSTLRKRSNASDDQVEDFIDRIKLTKETFVNAQMLHKSAHRLLKRLSHHNQKLESPMYPESISTLEEEAFGSDGDDEGDDDSPLFKNQVFKLEEEDEEENLPSLHPSDLKELQRAMMANAGAIRDFLLRWEGSSIPEDVFVKEVSRCKVVISRNNLDILLSRVRIKGQMSLSREGLLKLLWPQGNTTRQVNFRIDHLLDHLKRKVQAALGHGVDEKRIISDIVLYGVDLDSEESEFTETHLFRLVRRLSPSSTFFELDQTPDLSNRLYERLGQSPKNVSLFQALRRFLFDLAPLETEELDCEFLLACAKKHVQQVAREAAKDPVYYMKQLDENGDGLLPRNKFRQGLLALVPNLNHRHVEVLLDHFADPANENLVCYDKEFLDLLRVRSKTELQSLLATVQQIRHHVQAGSSRMDHYWDILRSADPENTGKVSRQVFRSIVCDELGLGSLLSEKQLQMILRWFGDDDEQIDVVFYQRFGRSIGPSVGQLDQVMDRLTRHLNQVSMIGGGQLDLRDVFIHSDSIGTGYVSRKQFGEVMNKLGLYPSSILSTQDAQVLLDSFDRNGEDKFDYISFASMLLCGATHDEHFQNLRSVAETVRKQLLHYRADPYREFEKFDVDLSGFVTLKAFFEACYNLYIPNNQKDLLQLANFFGWYGQEYPNHVRYRDMVRDLVRAGGPGGIFAASFKPVSSIPTKAQDTIWNSSNVTAWLEDENTCKDRKETFFNIAHELQRLKPFLKTPATKKKIRETTTISKDKRRVYDRTGKWDCPMCYYKNETVRFTKTCRICSAKNPYY